MTKKKMRTLVKIYRLIKPEALILVTLFTLVFAGIAAQPGISKFINQNIRSKQHTMERISELVPGTNISYIKERFGEPTFVNTVDNKLGYKEYVFVNEYVYVDVITNKDDKSIQLTITTRDSDFNPSIPVLWNSDSNLEVVLGKTKFSDIIDRPSLIQGCMGAHNWFYYEIYYLANPGNYQTVALGINDAAESYLNFDLLLELNKSICSREPKPYKQIDVLKLTSSDNVETYPDNERLQKFRQESIINSYTLTGPSEPVITGKIGIGVDINEVRILND